MKDKSGYSRLLKLMYDQGNRESEFAVGTMKSDTTLTVRGMDLSKDEYNVLDWNINRIHTGSSSDGASITITEKKESNLKKGNTVLVYIDDTDDNPVYLIIGKVV